MTYAEAVQIVAQQVVHRVVDAAYDCWEIVPEVGEDDWQDVVSAIAAMTASHDRFDEAYAFLAARADGAS